MNPSSVFGRIFGVIGDLLEEAEGPLGVVFALEGSAGSPSEIAFERECAKRTRWRCRVRCALINIRTGSADGYIEADGFGPTEAAAFQAGQNFLQNSTPPGFRTKHCHSVGCVKNK